MVGSPVYEMASILAQKAGCTVGAVYEPVNEWSTKRRSFIHGFKGRFWVKKTGNFIDPNQNAA
jgi:hypothetical protein